jgi:DNA-binding NtrC family response regulator
VEFTAEAEDLLSAYPWPGNVTELWNVICAVTAVAQGRQIQPEHLPRRIRSLHTWPTLAQHLEERRVAYLKEMLRCAGRDRAQAARLADVPESEFGKL